MSNIPTGITEKLLFNLFKKGKSESSKVISKKLIDVMRGVLYVYEMVFTFEDKKYSTNIAVWELGEIGKYSDPDTKQALLNVRPYIKKSKK